MLVFIDMDDVLCHFESEKEKLRQSNPEIEFPQSQIGFFENLPPIEYAIDSVKEMITSDKFDPYILTAPSILNPHCYSEKRLWVEKYFGLEFVEKLIICSNKGLLKGAVLIDDYTSGRGQENFQGELIHYGSDTYPGWLAVMNYLNAKII